MATCTIVEYAIIARTRGGTTLVGMEEPTGIVRHDPLSFDTNGALSPPLTYTFVTLQSDKPFKIRFGSADGSDPGNPDSKDHRFGANTSEPMMFPHRSGARFRIIEVA